MWSKFYQDVVQLCHRYPVVDNQPPESYEPLIKDFTVTQNSLQQVFLSLMRDEHVEPAAAVSKQQPIPEKE
jgi:hypothetical protein